MKVSLASPPPASRFGDGGPVRSRHHTQEIRTVTLSKTLSIAGSTSGSSVTVHHTRGTPTSTGYDTSSGLRHNWWCPSEYQLGADRRRTCSLQFAKGNGAHFAVICGGPAGAAEAGVRLPTPNAHRRSHSSRRSARSCQCVSSQGTPLGLRSCLRVGTPRPPRGGCAPPRSARSHRARCCLAGKSSPRA